MQITIAPIVELIGCDLARADGGFASSVVKDIKDIEKDKEYKCEISWFFFRIYQNIKEVLSETR